MGLTEAKKAKKLLNKYAPKGEKLAYINNKEAKLLKKLGGAGIDINGTGIKSYIEYDDSYGSGHASASSSSSGSDNGGGDNRENYISQQYVAPAPAPAPTPEPEYDTADFAFTTPSPSPQPDISGDDQEEDVAQMMVSMGITPDNAPTVSTLPDAEDDGESLYTKTIQINPVDEFGIKGSVYANTGFTPVSGPNVTYDTIANLPPPQPKGILQTIGGGLKTAAKVALPFVAPAFLPASLAKGYTTYNQAKTIANLANKVGLTDRTLPTLTELAKYNKNPGTGFKDNTFQSDSDDRPIPKDVITANVQKFSPKFNPEQINKAITFRDQLQSYAEIGRLNEKGQLTLQQLNNLIEQYQVSV